VVLLTKKKKWKIYSEVMIVVIFPMKRSHVPGWGSVVQSPSDLASQSMSDANKLLLSLLLLRGG